MMPELLTIASGHSALAAFRRVAKSSVFIFTLTWTVRFPLVSIPSIVTSVLFSSNSTIGTVRTQRNLDRPPFPEGRSVIFLKAVGVKVMKKTYIRQAGKTSVAVLALVIILTAAVAVLGTILFLKSRGASSASVAPAPAQAQNMSSGERGTNSPQTSPSSDNPKPSTPKPAPELSAEDIFRLASPSVVLIETFNESGERAATASGFIANESGAIITNYHVVRGAYSANVHLQDGSTFPVQGVIGFDPYRDVAVIKVSNLGTKALSLGDSERIQIGDKLIAIGSPLALQNTVSDGLVSGIRNGVIQTSSPISPGSSGGPFLNTHGQVVGIAVASIAAAENLNFAVPINWAKNYLRSTDVTSLSDLAKRNTVVKQLLASSVSVPAHERRVLPIVVDRNQMANPQLEGSFSSKGGAGGNIRVAVLNQRGVVYDSGRTTNGEIQLSLRPGAYQLVLDNSGSMMFSRTVTCDFKLRYVK
jgi:S1-C subfamily serine protease